MSKFIIEGIDGSNAERVQFPPSEKEIDFLNYFHDPRRMYFSRLDNAVQITVNNFNKTGFSIRSCGGVETRTFRNDISECDVAEIVLRKENQRVEIGAGGQVNIRLKIER